MADRSLASHKVRGFLPVLSIARRAASPVRQVTTCWRSRVPVRCPRPTTFLAPGLGWPAPCAKEVAADDKANNVVSVISGKPDLINLLAARRSVLRVKFIV